jgi:hypothetical protein
VSDGGPKGTNWVAITVGTALVIALLAGIVRGISSDPGSPQQSGSDARLASAGSAVHAGERRPRQRREERRQARQRRVRRRAGSRQREAHAARRSHGIVVSRCDWRSGSGCPPVPAPGSCRARGPLQDPGCTPGALNPAVTPATVHSTICASGYTDRIRPPTSYTTPLKLRLMAAYGVGGASTSRFELDHLISLELGGAPSDPRNLFPEAYSTRLGASQKDVIENRLNDEVCSGAISLSRAQHEILDWVGYQSGSPSSGQAPSRRSASPGGAATLTPSSSTKCDPSYRGACLNPHAPDYDCAGGGGDGPKFVQGPVRVVGSDHFHLDSDGDGVACE